MSSYLKMDRGYSARAYLMILAKVLIIAIAGLAVGRGVVAGGLGDSASQETPNYNEWIAGYRRGPLQMDDGTIRTLGANGEPRPVVVITAIEGDDLEPDEKVAAEFGRDYRIVRYGCSVSSEGRVSFFYHRFDDSKGSGYPVISKENLERLRTLLSKLPDDHAHLPATGRRLVVQVPLGAQVLARVYDRANLPDEILEISRLSSSGILSWAPKFSPRGEWEIAQESSIYGAIAFSPDGKQIVTALLDGIDVWDAESHALVQSLRYSAMRASGNDIGSPGLPYHLIFSPNGLTAIVGDYGDLGVRDSRTWQGIKNLRLGNGPRLLHPQFTTDGSLLFVESEQPELLIFDTKTWERRGLLPQIPTDAIAYFPSRDNERAVYISKSAAIKLWDAGKRRDVALLENGRIIDLSFSPDQSLVAAVVAHDNVQANMSTVRDNRICVWRTNDGTLLHELRPFEVSGYFAGDVHWWADGKYLLATIWANAMFTEHGIGIWDVNSGRFRGEFAGCAGRFEVSAERKELVTLCGNTATVWDVAEAIRQIESISEFAAN